MMKLKQGAEKVKIIPLDLEIVLDCLSVVCGFFCRVGLCRLGQSVLEWLPQWRFRTFAIRGLYNSKKIRIFCDFNTVLH